MERLGAAWRGWARRVGQGEARLGKARQGKARRGKARQGKGNNQAGSVSYPPDVCEGNNDI